MPRHQRSTASGGGLPGLAAERRCRAIAADRRSRILNAVMVVVGGGYAAEQLYGFRQGEPPRRLLHSFHQAFALSPPLLSEILRG